MISNALIKEIDKLKEEVKELMANIKIKEEQLNKVETEASKMTQKTLKDKSDMEKYIDEMKKSHANAIKLKDMEIKTFVEQNNCQKKEIEEMKEKILELNSDLVEQTKINNSKDEIICAKNEENNVLRGDFECDKCNFSTTDLSILVKHKANEHKPVMKCDHCKFKSIKISDLKLHSLLHHGELTLKKQCILTILL